MNMNLFDTAAAVAIDPPAMGLIVDNFAGGGGASTGIEQALGRAVDIAINHDEDAIRMHEVNHPGTQHIRNNIWQLDPVEVTGGKPVELAWFSPDCKHFSKAKGGKPREKSIRDLAWVVVLWAERVRPALILLENVEEFRTWGPLDDEGFPIKERAGETFQEWTRQLRKEGYKIQWKELRACDYGAPTIRKRFFMIARRDGLPIVWPAPTHGKPGSPEVLSGKRLPWRTAADIIDWSIPCPSIFERDRPLAEKTLRRIAHGIVKFVLDNPSPFIVPVKTWGGGGNGPRDLHEPMRTTTTSKGGEHALVTPYFARTAHGDVDKNGKRRGQPCHGPAEPFPTVTQSGDSALIVPHITKFRSNAIGSAADEPVPTVTANSFIKRPGGAAPLGRVDVRLAPFATYAQQGGANRPVDEPFHTVTASRKDQNCFATAKLSPVQRAAATMIHCGNGERQGQDPRAKSVDAPLGTVMAQRNNHGAVVALMQKFADNGQGYDPTEPLHTVMAGAPRHAVIAAHLEQANGSPEGEKPLAGRAADDPLATVTAKGSQQRVITSHLMKMRGTCQHGATVEEPAPTVTSGGNHVAEVRAFLIKYFGTDQDPRLEEPLHTVTSKHRFACVTVMIEGELYEIVDIGMRMLTPGELFAAQGFPADYIIDRDAEGRPMTKTSQVARCGNSVCPPLSRALVEANAPSLMALAQPELPSVIAA